jgi:alpha-tubulin suppressor-like RCC1 family protein
MPSCILNNSLENTLANVVVNSSNTGYVFNSVETREKAGYFIGSFQILCDCNIRLQILGRTTPDLVNITINNNIHQSFFLYQEYDDFIAVKAGEFLRIEMPIDRYENPNYIFGFINVENRPNTAYCISNHFLNRKNAFVTYTATGYVLENLPVDVMPYNFLYNYFECVFTAVCNNTVIHVNIQNDSESYKVYLQKDYDPVIEILPNTTYTANLSRNYNEGFYIYSDNYNGDVLRRAGIRVETSVISASYPSATPTPTVTLPTPTPTSTGTPTPTPSSTYCGLVAKCVSPYSAVPPNGFEITGLCAGNDGYYFINNSTEGHVYFETSSDGDLLVEITNNNLYNTVYAVIDGNANYIKKANPYSATISVTAGDSVKIQYLPSNSAWKNGEIIGKVYFILPTPTPTPSLPSSTAVTPTPTPSQTSNSSCSCMSATAYYGTISNGNSACTLNFKPTNVISSTYEDYYYFEFSCDGYVEISYVALQKFKYAILKNNSNLFETFTNKQNQSGYKLVPVSSGDTILIKLYATGFVFQENDFFGTIKYIENQPTPTPTPSPTQYCGIKINDSYLSDKYAIYTTPCSYLFNLKTSSCVVGVNILIDGYLTVNYDSKKTKWYFYQLYFNNDNLIEISLDEDVKGTLCIPVIANRKYYLVVEGQQGSGIFSSLDVEFNWSQYSASPTPSPSATFFHTPTPTPTPLYNLISYGYNKDAQCGLGYTSNSFTNYSVQNATLFAPSSVPWSGLGKNRTSASAIREDAKAFVWGSNAYNKLGTNTLPANPYLSPTAILEDKNIFSIVDGYKRMYYLTIDGDLWGCGDNSYGALGNNNTTNVTSPIFLSGDRSNPWIKIDAGVDFAAGIKSDGTLWTWGKNTHGNLGTGNNTDYSSPVQIIKSPGAWVDLSCGDNHVVAKWRNPLFKYSFYSWGQNSSGQIGDNTVISRNTPVLVRADLNWTNFSCGSNFTYALNASNNWPYSYTGYFGYNYLHSWGNNTDKKIHQKMDLPSNFDSVLLPVQVNQLNTWTGKHDEPYVNSTFVSSSENNAAVLDVFGKEIVFGKNEYYVTNPNRSFNYQLNNLSLGNGFLIGIPKNYNPPIPTPVATLPCLQLLEKSNIDVVPYTDAEGSGFKWSIAETNFGDNYVGFLINCPNVNVYTFGRVKFAGIKGAVKYSPDICLGGGYLYSFEYKSDFEYVGKYAISGIIEFSLEYDADTIDVGAAEGIIKIVGDSGVPTLTPDSSSTPTPTPTESPFPTPFPTVEGVLALWGDNQYGQLGLGDKDNKSIPTQLGTEKNWNAGDGGNGFTIALKSDNKIYSWGKNDLGQLGKGDKDYISSPLQISGNNKWINIAAGGNVANAIQKQPITQTPTLTPTPTPTSTPCASLLPLSLYMQGLNDYGQLGRNTSKDRHYYNGYEPVLGNSVGWKDVAMGSSFTAAVKYDGTLWTWGLNVQGQLGDGTKVNRSSPVQTKSLGTNWLNVTAGITNVVAVKQDNSMWAWGGDTIFGCYRGYNVASPVEVCGNTKSWAQAYAGNNFVLARKLDNSLWGWGSNNYGQLGNNDINSYILTPIQVGLLTSDWLQITTSYFNSGGIKSDGSLYMWGLNTYGQLGTGDFSHRSNPTQIVASGTDWKFISCGWYSTFAIKTNGTMWAWGSLSQYANINSPIQVANNTDGWVYIDGRTSTAIKEDGSLWRLSNSENSLLSPNILDVPCGGKWFKVVSDFTSGLWSFAFLNGPTPTPKPTDPTPTPTPTFTPSPTPSPTQSPTWTPAPSLPFVQGGLARVNTKTKRFEIISRDSWLYSTFNGHIYEFHAINTENKLYKIVSSVDSSYSASFQITNSTDWYKIYEDIVFYSYNIGIKTDGTMWAWGVNNINDAGWRRSGCDQPNGILGTGDTVSQKYPVQTGLNTSDWAKAALGVTHVAAIKNNGTLWAWGSNCYGKLGDGTLVHRSQPVQEAHHFTDWIDVCCLDYSTVGLRSDGSVWIWGRRFSNLFDNQQADMPVRSKITLDGWKSISSSNHHLLLLHRNGTVWSGGTGVFGELGLGGGQAIFPIQQIQYLNNIKEIRAGYFKSYALTDNGNLYVWGDNGLVISYNPPLYGGSLGDGTIDARNFPVVALPDKNWIGFGIKIDPTPTPTPTSSPTPTPTATPMGTGPTPTPTLTATPLPSAPPCFIPEKMDFNYFNAKIIKITEDGNVFSITSKAIQPEGTYNPQIWQIQDVNVLINCDGNYKITLMQLTRNNTKIAIYEGTKWIDGGLATNSSDFYMCGYYKKGTRIYVRYNPAFRTFDPGSGGYFILTIEKVYDLKPFEFVEDLKLCKRVFGYYENYTLQNNYFDGFYNDITGDLGIKVEGSACCDIYNPYIRQSNACSHLSIKINRSFFGSFPCNCRDKRYSDNSRKDPLDGGLTDFDTGVYNRSFGIYITKLSRIYIEFTLTDSNVDTYCRLFAYVSGKFEILAEANSQFPIISKSGNLRPGTILVIAFSDSCEKCSRTYGLVGDIYFSDGKYYSNSNFLI